jgi:hypothetical protein
MKVGDLVRCAGACPSRYIGVVIKVEYEEPKELSFAPYKVRWTDHTNSKRDWYRENELVKL